MTKKKRPSASPTVPPVIPAETPPAADAGFPIVGIGASAGGLAAFEAFFSGMPADADPGMAFVLVQHLAPDHKSILTDLIRRYTRMQVFEVEDGMAVAPNCAYIIPPGRDMVFLNGTLQLLEPSAPRDQRLPIDFFFRSLAHDQRERASGVVLSGTGSDGTLGIRAIKGEGGMVMAQNPASTEYDGAPFWARLAATAAQDVDGAPVCRIALSDITVRQQAEAALRESEERYRHLFESASDALFLIDTDTGLVVEANSMASELYGYDRAELRTMKAVDLSAEPEETSRRTHEVQTIPDRVVSIPLRLHRKKDGTVFPVEITARFFTSQGRPVLLVAARDITARQQAEAAAARHKEALRESEQRYRQLVETLQEGIWMIDQDACTTFVNPRMAEMLGYTVEEMLGRHLFSFMDEPGIQIATRNLARRQAGIKEQHDFEFRHQDGTRIYASLETSPVTDPDGSYRGAIAGVQDITARKQAEEQLRASLQEKEILLQEVHHRVKNNLQVISSLLDIQALQNPDPQVLQALRDSQSRVRTMALVHEQLYRSADLARVNLADYIRSLASYLFGIYADRAAGVALDVQVADVTLGLDAAIPCGLIVGELVSNALKYAFPLTGDAPAARGIRIALRSPGAGQFVLTISDNGVGLPPNLDAQDPPTLGLRLVALLTQQLQGTLAVERQAGTAFTIAFTERKRGREVGR